MNDWKSEHAGSSRGNRGRRHRHLWAMGMVGGLIALAVWGKLRFVSDVPRMAYAEPESSRSADAETPGHASDEGAVPVLREHP